MAYTLGTPADDPLAVPPSRVGSRAGGGRGGSSKPSPQQDLEARRAGLDSRFKSIYDSLGAQRAAGPFTPDVLAALFGQAASGAAGAARRDSNMIRDSFAARGIGGGSGAELGQLLSAQRSADAGLSRAQSQLGVQAALENYSAQERALAGMRDLLGQEAGYQAQFSALQADPLTKAVEQILAKKPQTVGAGGGGGGGNGGGLGALAALLGGGSDWLSQWQKDQQATEDQAAALRAAHYAPQAPAAGRSTGGVGGVMDGGGNPFTGALGLMWGTNDGAGGAGYGGVPTAYGGVNIPGQFQDYATGGRNAGFASAFDRRTPGLPPVQPSRPPATNPYAQVSGTSRSYISRS